MTHIETETNLNWDTYHHPNPAMSWDVMGSVAQGETRWESLFAAPWLHMLWNLDHYSSGWWYTYPSEKYESVGMMTFPMEKLNSCSKPPTSHRLIAPNRSRQKKTGIHMRTIWKWTWWYDLFPIMVCASLAAANMDLDGWDCASSFKCGPRSVGDPDYQQVSYTCICPNP